MSIHNSCSKLIVEVPTECYKEGNHRALRRHRILLRLLAQFGIEPERCRFDYVSAREGDRFLRLVAEMTDTLRGLGPLRLSHSQGG